MTLDKVTRYDSGRADERGKRAVVLGGSMAGMLAARILSDAYREVTIVERDSLSGEPSARRGVPQGHHVHVLLEAGRAILGDLFPGYGEDLIQAGGLIIDVGDELRHYERGGFLARPATRMEMYCASRPLIEAVVRDRLLNSEGVELRSDCQFTEYLTGSNASAIEGVRVRDGGEDDLPADLVVDATGRTSRTPKWLSEHGYPSPTTDEVHVDVNYSSIRLERPRDDRQMLFAPQSAPRTIGGAAFPVEDGEWLVTLGGMHDSDPPAEADAFREYAARLPIDGIEELLREYETISDGVDQYPFPSNRRQYYEDLDHFPDGLVVIGDAIASFNPIYGQGMSVAALESMQLHKTLATPDTGPLGPRFFDAAEEVVDIAWSMAVGADMEFNATNGPEPRGATLFNRYLSRLIRQAHTDGRLSEAFYRVVGMETAPTALLQPRTVWRTIRPRSTVG